MTKFIKIDQADSPYEVYVNLESISYLSPTKIIRHGKLVAGTIITLSNGNAIISSTSIETILKEIE